MKRTLIPLGAVAIALMIAACGNSNEPVKPQAPPPPKETVFDDLIANKERAKQDADRATEQRKQNLDAAMKEAEGTATAP